MDTKTHALMGVALGQTMYDGNLLLMGAALAGSVVPDVPAAGIAIWDTFIKKQPAFSSLSRFEKTALHIVNSLPVVIVAGGILVGVTSGVWHGVILTFWLWYLAHLAIDVLTHGNGENPDFSTVTYTWPFSYSLSKLFGM